MITLEVKQQGESIKFFSEADSSAVKVENEVTLAPGAEGPPAHIHLNQTETFNVVSGKVIAKLGKEEKVINAGEILVVAPGQSHTFYNGNETEPLVIHAVVEPALHFQWFLTEMAKSAIRAGGSWKEMPLLEVAHILHQARDEYQLSGMPVILQRVIFGSLSGVARLFGKTKNIAPKT